LRRTLLVALGVLACAGCGDNGGATAGAGGGTTGAVTSSNATATAGTGTAATSTSTGTSGGIPDAGSSDQVDQDFTDLEPNDTPETATPLGTAVNAGVGVWVTNNTIGGTDTADYFVFKMSQAGPFTFDICFGTSLTGMTVTLWKVVGGVAQDPPVGTWTTATGCVDDFASTPMLEANTEYLLGLTVTGGPGGYGA
jgi:hypothetical protein